MLTINISYIAIGLILLFTGIYIGLWLSNLKFNSLYNKLNIKEDNDSSYIDKYNNLSSRYKELERCFLDLSTELYFLNYCENCSHLNHKNGMCLKGYIKDGFCKHWYIGNDMNVLMHKWYVKMGSIKNDKKK